MLSNDVKTGKIGNLDCGIVKYQYSLLLVIVAIACSGLLGCGGAAPTQIVSPIEIKEESLPFTHDHAAGLETARQERKPMLIFFSVPNNVGSQRMLDTTFRDDEIKSLAERFVCIHIDGSQELGLCESLEITSFPTIILSNTGGAEVRRLVGGQTPDQLAVQMHVVLQATALRPQMTAGR